MLPRLGTQVWGAKSEKLECPAAPIQQPRERRPFWEQMLLHVRWACSGSRFEREQREGARNTWPGERSPPFCKAVLRSSPASCQFPNPLGRVGLRNKRQLWLV